MAATRSLSGAGTASRSPAERVARSGFQACAVASAVLAVATVGVLLAETALFFTEVPASRLFTERTWNPFFEDPGYGILPLVAATAQITAGAAVIGVPVGLMTAIYLQVYAGPRMSAVLSAAVSCLAGVPTVVYGYFALNFVTPLLARVWPGTEAFNGASASLVTGLMILPAVAALCREALASVPRSHFEGGLALGISHGQAVGRILLPAAKRGILAAVLIALARAAGETMIVAMAAGSHAQLTWNPLEGIRTLTAVIVQAAPAGSPPDGLEYRALFVAGTVLFVGTYALHAAGRAVLARGSGDEGRGA